MGWCLESFRGYRKPVGLLHSFLLEWASFERALVCLACLVWLDS